MNHKAPLEGISVLILDGDHFAADAVARCVRGAGGIVTGIFSSARLALASLTQFPPDAAVIDPLIDGECSHEVAHALRVAQIPFLIYTGHELEKAQQFPTTPLLMKNRPVTQVVDVLAQITRAEDQRRNTLRLVANTRVTQWPGAVP